jgi:hypothetical protein
LRPWITSRVNSNGFADFVEDVRALDSPSHAVTKHRASFAALQRDRTQ